MPDRAAQRRSTAAALAGLAARAALVISGVAVAVRFVVPAVTAPQPAIGTEELEPEDDGRGRHQAPPSRPALAAGHETADMNPGLMARVLVSLAGIAFLMVFLMIGFESLIIPQREHRQAALTPQQTTHEPPPAPNLQADPVMDLSHLRAAEDQLLNNYARIDDQHGRIPIDRAMALIIGHPLDTAP